MHDAFQLPFSRHRITHGPGPRPIFGRAAASYCEITRDTARYRRPNFSAKRYARDDLWRGFDRDPDQRLDFVPCDFQLLLRLTLSRRDRSLYFLRPCQRVSKKSKELKIRGQLLFPFRRIRRYARFLDNVGDFVHLTKYLPTFFLITLIDNLLLL